MAKSKKRKRPIYKFALEDYFGEIKHPLDGDSIDFKNFVDAFLCTKKDYRIVLDTCIFKNVSINQNVFVRSEFIDCTFIDCDLGNNEFQNCTFMRCEFKNTRLTGSHFIESYVSHVLIEKSQCNYIDFANTKLENCEFVDSLFQESNFYENEVINLSFEQLKLEKATFYQTSLNNVNVGSSEIFDIKIDQKSVRGMKIASHQAREVCSLLGVKVVD